MTTSVTDVDRDVDVVIVGGGMAGVSVAAAIGSGREVVVVEGEAQLAQHSTGRSAASFVTTFGPSPVRALTRASRAAIEDAGSHGAPLLTPRPVMWAAFDDEALVELDNLCAEAPGLERLGPDGALRRHDALLESELIDAAVEEGACDIDVLGLHQFSVRRARNAGVEIRTGAHVIGIDSTPDDGVMVDTTNGRFRCRTVVNAAGSWADHIAELFGATPAGMRPLRRTIAVARPGRDVDPDWPFVIDLSGRCYFKPEGPNVLVSPADETPVEPGDARAEEIDVAFAVDRVNEVTDLRLRSVQSSWAGLRTFAPDGCPVVGFDPDVVGLFWFAGQGGYGIQMAPALADVGASLLLGEAVPDHVMAEGLDLDDLLPRT